MRVTGWRMSFLWDSQKVTCHLNHSWWYMTLCVCLYSKSVHVSPCVSNDKEAGRSTLTWVRQRLGWWHRLWMTGCTGERCIITSLYYSKVAQSRQMYLVFLAGCSEHCLLLTCLSLSRNLHDNLLGTSKKSPHLSLYNYIYKKHTK